jgi:hypothetical protein
MGTRDPPDLPCALEGCPCPALLSVRSSLRNRAPILAPWLWALWLLCPALPCLPQVRQYSQDTYEAGRQAPGESYTQAPSAPSGAGAGELLATGTEAHRGGEGVLPDPRVSPAQVHEEVSCWARWAWACHVLGTGQREAVCGVAEYCQRQVHEGARPLAADLEQRCGNLAGMVGSGRCHLPEAAPGKLGASWHDCDGKLARLRCPVWMWVGGFQVVLLKPLPEIFRATSWQGFHAAGSLCHAWSG